MDKKEYNRQYSRESYQWYKEHGICTRCHEEKAVPGITMCSGCRAKEQDNARDRYAKDPSKKRARDARKKQKCLAEHICMRCSTPMDPEWSKQLCPACTERKNRKARESYRRRKYTWIK